jgi:hypothetical protein
MAIEEWRSGDHESLWGNVEAINHSNTIRAGLVAKLKAIKEKSSDIWAQFSSRVHSRPQPQLGTAKRQWLLEGIKPSSTTV